MRYHCVRALLVLSLSIASAPAEDLFVDNLRGDDARDGRSLLTTAAVGGPVRSLTRALELARGGDRIVMANTGEPYRESVTIFGGRNSGTQLGPFVIEGNGAVLEGSRPVPPQAWEAFRGDIFRFRPPRSAFAQLFLDGPPAVRHYLTSASGVLPTLEPREWCLADGMIYFRVDQGKLPRDYALTFASLSVGVTLYEVHDVVIENLTVQGFQLDGINAHDCAKDCVLRGVIARGNGRAGIAVGGASTVVVEASLVSDNGAAQILASGPSVTAIEGSEIPAEGVPVLLRTGGRVFRDGAPVP